MKDTYDLIVVGGGVLGTFHAYHAVKKGLKVALFEKNKQPQGATVRNFGQVVPSGMNAKWQTYGRESLRIYKEIQAQFDISVRQEGSVYIASNQEEVQLLEELALINKANEYPSHLLTKSECLKQYSGLKREYVKMGLFFPEEVMVEPRIMITKVHGYLRHLGVAIFMDTAILECHALVNDVVVHTAKNQSFSAKKVLICNGSEFKTLFPKLFNESDLVVSKLQMMQTAPQKNYMLKGSVLTGLSIRRYEAFQECPSFASIKQNEPQHSFVKQWGIHILFKQAVDGSVIIGDSHEYAAVKNSDTLGFDLHMEVDDFILEEAKRIVELPNYTIKKRWFGMYSQCENSDLYQHTIDSNIHIITGIGGKGMTGSAGFSKHNIQSIFNF
ncbi:TIGR03364 family FAD-dependent oxidoreductase [Arenibacter sp. GZD96]|uniref:TIGR03364 family FAD-dependent oxidoreductase n=1 Tax=Aurantibrevibacter litoralis TaxID=3106030 RepID=UPI002B002295|nr:TIGR03364 family FAD-dependent oxidoreductase [Arenibacter sp. GZD-96]MEA1786532.1 TIGR03364 family FAD-dependent oxidoreductase [Arenibacter sp. GZD-96]